MIMLASGVPISGTGFSGVCSMLRVLRRTVKRRKRRRRPGPPISDAMPDRAGNLLGGFPDQARPGALHAIGGRGDRKTRHDNATIVPNARADAAHAELGLFVVHGVAVAADALELLFERAHGGKS